MNPTTPSNRTTLLTPYAPTLTDYADALDQLGKTAQTQIRTPGALATNLLADALLQYGQKRAQQPQVSGGTGYVFPQAENAAAAARLATPQFSLDGLTKPPIWNGSGS